MRLRSGNGIRPGGETAQGSERQGYVGQEKGILVS